jgi:hypothetical protein
VKIGMIPENLFERLALALGLVPAPAIEAWFSFMLARVIMAGTKVGGLRGTRGRTVDVRRGRRTLRHGPPGHGQAAQRPDRRRLRPLHPVPYTYLQRPHRRG